MKVLIDRVFLEWDELETPEEYEIMKRYAENGRRYSLGYSRKNQLNHCVIFTSYTYRFLLFLKITT